MVREPLKHVAALRQIFGGFVGGTHPVVVVESCRSIASAVKPCLFKIVDPSYPGTTSIVDDGIAGRGGRVDQDYPRAGGQIWPLCNGLMMRAADVIVINIDMQPSDVQQIVCACFIPCRRDILAFAVKICLRDLEKTFTSLRSERIPQNIWSNSCNSP
jgi:hypothetical protein